MNEADADLRIETVNFTDCHIVFPLLVNAVALEREPGAADRGDQLRREPPWEGTRLPTSRADRGSV
jgi:hypothetical protein